MSETEFLARLFPGLERRSPGSDETAHRIGALCALGSGVNVLVAGSGAGATSRLLVRAYGCEVTCADSERGTLDALVEAARRDGTEALVRPMHVASLKLLAPTGTGFDVVVLEGASRWLGSFAAAASLARGLLAPSGRAALTAPGRVGRTLPAAVAAHHQRRGEPPRFPRDLAAEFEAEGFEPLAAEAMAEPIVDDYYRRLEQAIERLGADGAEGAGELRRDIEVHRREGGRASVAEVLLVGRRKEPGERPPPGRGQA